MLDLLRLGVGLLLALFSAAAEAEHEVESGLLLDVVVGEGSAVFQLLAGENEALLIRRNTFLVLNFALTLSIVSEDSTSRVIVLPVRVFTKICIAAALAGGGNRPLNLG